MKQTRDASGANRRTGGTKHWLLAAAIASVPLWSLAGVSSAQMASPNNGHARDANTRVGSNGVNGGGVSRGGTAVSPNNIIYGNVTRGQEFRGPVGSFDSREFHGATADTASSAFIRDSAGAAVRGNANLNNTYSAQPFYGSERAVAPPVGSVPLGTSGGYVTPTLQQSAITLKPGDVNNPWVYGDLGSIYNGGGTLNSPLRSQFGSNVLTGQTFQGQDQSLLLVSPLAGMREAPISELNGYFSSQTGRLPAGGQTDRFRATQADIDRMRAELNGQSLNNNAPNNGANPNGTTGQQQENGLQIGRPAAQPFDSPDNSPLSNGVRSTNLNAQPLSNQTRTGEGTTLVRPGDVQNQAVRDAQVTELQRRLDRFAADSGQSPTSPNGAAPGAPGTSGAPATPGTPAAPGTPGTPQRQPPAGSPVPLPNPARATPGTGTGAATTRPAAAAPAARPAAPARGAAAPAPQPVEVRSLAAGVTAPGLRQTLATAEQQMREGKFASALEQYDVAEQVAPNDPLIWLGKADAELGQSSYRTAEAHIRQAFNADRALLMGRYDLNSLIGASRVQVLRKDLTDIAQANPKDPMASFLLAYLDYNTGNGPGAAAHLNEAERRTGRADPTIAQMRQHWDLKTVAPARATPAPAPAATTRPAAPSLNK